MGSQPYGAVAHVVQQELPDKYSAHRVREPDLSPTKPGCGLVTQVKPSTGRIREAPESVGDGKSWVSVILDTAMVLLVDL